MLWSKVGDRWVSASCRVEVIADVERTAQFGCVVHCFGRRGPLLWLASGPRRPRAMFSMPRRARASSNPIGSNGPRYQSSIARCSSCAGSRIASRKSIKPSGPPTSSGGQRRAHPQRPNTQWPDRCREPLRRSRRDAGCRRRRRHKRTGPHRARSRYPTARFVRSPPCSVGLPLALRGIGPPHSSVNRDILWRHIPPSRFIFFRQDPRRFLRRREKPILFSMLWQCADRRPIPGLRAGSG